MSALPPEAEMLIAGINVCKVPLTDVNDRVGTVHIYGYLDHRTVVTWRA